MPGTGAASAAITWWYSSGPHDSGVATTFREQGDQLRVCNVNSDGYRTLADVQTAADGHDIAEKRSYRLRVCLIKTGQRPSYCKTYDTFHNNH